MTRFSELLIRLSSGWITLAALLLFSSFIVFVLPQQSERMTAAVGSSASPDLSIWYTPQDLYRMAADYGATGRSAYVRIRLSFDLVWPLVYALFLTTAISWVFSRRLGARESLRRLNLLPLAGLGFDYLENAATSIVMLRYPDQTPLIDPIAPVFTLLKWGFIASAFIALGVGLIAAVLSLKLPRDR